MRKYILLLLLLPISLYAGTREMDMWNGFSTLIQPTPKSEISQNGMYAQYSANESTLTDTITYKIGSKKWTTKGPWSLANESLRQKVRDCKKKTSLSASGCGWYDYSIIRLSPSGKYIELQGIGYESEIWRMLDTRTAKIVLSNDNGVTKSMWTEDKKQFIWETGNCEIGGCVDLQGTFITKIDKFPQYSRFVNTINNDSTNPKEILKGIGFLNLSGYTNYLEQLRNNTYQGIVYDLCKSNQDGCLGEPSILTMTLQRNGTYLVEFSYKDDAHMVDFLRGYVDLSKKTFFSLNANHKPDGPITSGTIELASITCPTAKLYSICGGINSGLHNKFAIALKKKDITTAIKYWDSMIGVKDGTENYPLENILLEPLFGDMTTTGGNQLLPNKVIAKKAYKGGILFLGDMGIQDVDFSFYYLGYLSYNKDSSGTDMVYIYNQPLVPKDSKQYKIYEKLYGYQDFGSFNTDMKNAFYNGKYNNASVNEVYKKFVSSI